MGVSALYRGSVYAGLAGIACPVLCWFAGSGLKDLLLAPAPVQRLRRLLAAITSAGVGIWVVSQSDYRVQIFGYEMSGITWCAVGVVLGYIRAREVNT
jgi:hypothetical protein